MTVKHADAVNEPILRHTGTGTTLSTTGDNALYYHRNQQYSIIGLTNAAGTLVERYSYTAYGTLGIYDPSGTVRTTSTYANRYTYTGREYDPDLNLYHFRARWYDPSTGGFISRDPLGYVDGMSLYRGYFGVSGVDPSGTLTIAQDGVIASAGKIARGGVPTPPVFGTTGETVGVLDPGKQYPGATSIINIWGAGEAKGVTDYYVEGCKGWEDNINGRKPTKEIADRSVDIVLIRNSPIRCCELKEICRVCKNGCLVILSFPNYSGVESEDNLVPHDDAGMWGLFTKCLGSRFSSATRKRYKAQIIVNGLPEDLPYWGWHFWLGAGDCPKADDPVHEEKDNKVQPSNCS